MLYLSWAIANGIFAWNWVSYGYKKGIAKSTIALVEVFQFVHIIVIDLLIGQHFDALWSGATAGYFLYLYFKNGGGKGTKRKLKQWAKKFHGVRRTAPALGK